MDISSIAGIFAGISLIVWGILSGGSSISNFIDVASMFITVGGTICATFLSYPLSEVLQIGKIFSNILKERKINIIETIRQIIELANTARRDGLLSLEEAAASMDNEFMKKGVSLIVDGTDPELVKSILEAELYYIDARHTDGRKMFDTIATLAPAFGLIGTLIGLVSMLNELSDPSTLGPKMAVALITTFYGAILANMFCIPISHKLSIRSAREQFLYQIIIEGLLSIQAGENPRLIEEKLKAFLSPSIKKSIEGSTEQS